MAGRSKGYYPYKSLGNRLKVIRERQKQSLTEVSGAVEIEVDMLTSIELGTEKPSEDILLLLISYFGIKEDEADKLWALADYDQSPTQETSTKPSMIVSPSDARIIYTDLIYVTGNQHGVVMNFMQESGPQGQPLIVSRVGMSREHARSVLDVLQQTLDASPKSLPAPTKSKRQNKSKRQRS